MKVSDAKALELFRAVGKAVADEKSAQEAAANDGYGCCPKCLKVNPPGTRRERRPDGNTKCGDCGETSSSRAWQSAAQAELTAARQRHAQARVALVDAATGDA